MDYLKYFKMKNAEIPGDIAKSLEYPGNITETLFENKNDILENEQLQQETGYIRMGNGDFQVSMICPMPNVTKEMIDWWFWWHPQEDERYQLWFPGEHYKTGYAKKSAAYFESREMPEFQENIQYPVERIGTRKIPLMIDFISPEEFGFSKVLMEKCNVATIVCGHVGACRGLVSHTEMAHIFFQRENGLFLVSRFWIGKRLKNPLLRKRILTFSTAKGMAVHCCVEYRNLADKLPLLYEEWFEKYD